MSLIFHSNTKVNLQTVKHIKRKELYCSARTTKVEKEPLHLLSSHDPSFIIDERS